MTILASTSVCVAPREALDDVISLLGVEEGCGADFRRLLPPPPDLVASLEQATTGAERAMAAAALGRWKLLCWGTASDPLRCTVEDARVRFETASLPPRAYLEALSRALPSARLDVEIRSSGSPGDVDRYTLRGGMRAGRSARWGGGRAAA